MATASSVLGPWRDAPLPITNPVSDWDVLGFNCSNCSVKHCSGCFTSAPLCAPWAAGCPTNPSPLLLADGSALMVAEGGYGCAVGERVALFKSPALDGPWKLASPPIPGFNWSEDPFLWRTRRGFHLLTHSGSPCVLGYSTDGHLWHTANGGGYNYTVEWEGHGSSLTKTKMRRRERPHLIFDPADPETPLVLLNGVEDPEFGRECTLAQRVQSSRLTRGHP